MSSLYNNVEPELNQQDLADTIVEGWDEDKVRQFAKDRLEADYNEDDELYVKVAHRQELRELDKEVEDYHTKQEGKVL